MKTINNFVIKRTIKNLESVLPHPITSAKPIINLSSVKSITNQSSAKQIIKEETKLELNYFKYSELVNGK